MTPLRIALVGAGNVGLRAHLPAILESLSVNLVAFADPCAVDAYRHVKVSDVFRDR